MALIRPRKISTGIILYHPQKSSVLLALRDDIPTIKFPNQYDIFGGGVEGDETPFEAITRELGEELSLKATGAPLTLPDVELFSIFVDTRLTQQNIFVATLPYEIEELTLHEGQSMRWFTEEEVKRTPLAFDFNPVVESFFTCLKAHD
jgi:8-oxo-dGTP diphosphatase